MICHSGPERHHGRQSHLAPPLLLRHHTPYSARKIHTAIRQVPESGKPLFSVDDKPLLPLPSPVENLPSLAIHRQHFADIDDDTSFAAALLTPQSPRRGGQERGQGGAQCPL